MLGDRRVRETARLHLNVFFFLADCYVDLRKVCMFFCTNWETVCSLWFRLTNSSFMTSNFLLSIQSRFVHVSHYLRVDYQISYCLRRGQRVSPIVITTYSSTRWLEQTLFSSALRHLCLHDLTTQADLILSRGHTCSFPTLNQFCRKIISIVFLSVT